MGYLATKIYLENRAEGQFKMHLMYYLIFSRLKQSIYDPGRNLINFKGFLYIYVFIKVLVKYQSTTFTSKKQYEGNF